MTKKQDFDLEERTAQFGEKIIDLAKSISADSVNDVLVKQIVRSGTSVGANYMEADSAGTKKDFKYKIDLCRKEAKETKHWLRMIAKANSDKKDRIRGLWQEADELTRIFSSISKSCQQE